MSPFRQLGSGLIYALVSVVLVVGGLSVALAEGGFNTASPATPPTLQPSLEPGTTAAVTSTSASPTSSAIISTAIVAASATVQPLIVTATPIPPSATLYPSPRPTWTRIVYATRIPCGPYAGWVLSYIVQPHDTLFHIATLYRTTVQALQIANCKANTFIFVGERLWVPNLPTITPGVTLIPTFPTLTEVPTEPLTLTPLPYFTETAVPTALPTDVPTSTNTPTQ